MSVQFDARRQTDDQPTGDRAALLFQSTRRIFTAAGILTRVLQQPLTGLSERDAMTIALGC